MTQKVFWLNDDLVGDWNDLFLLARATNTHQMVQKFNAFSYQKFFYKYFAGGRNNKNPDTFIVLIFKANWSFVVQNHILNNNTMFGHFGIHGKSLNDRQHNNIKFVIAIVVWLFFCCCCFSFLIVHQSAHYCDYIKRH